MFERSLFFLLFIPFFILLYFYFFKKMNLEGFFISSSQRKGSTLGFIKSFYHYIFLIISISLLIISLVNPKKTISQVPVEKKGKAIVFCIDVSSSMMALDFGNISRLSIAKSNIVEFIKKRPHDFYSVVIFAGSAFTYIPLTFDNQFVIDRIEELQPKMLEEGTAIGYGIEMGIDQIKNYEGNGKIIILLTDGINNKGIISPFDAAKYAAEYNISIYPIAIGKQKNVPFPYRDEKGEIKIRNIDLPIDFQTLNTIASISGTNIVIKADDPDTLKQAFNKIDQLESMVYTTKMYSNYEDQYMKYMLDSYIFFIIFVFFMIFKQKIEY